MADNTPIEWTDATWNPITGCSIVSPGCTNCYAMKLAGGRLRHHPSRQGLTKASKVGPVWTGEVRFNEAELLRPLRWRRPRKIFACAHGDLFHEDVPPSWIAKVFAIAALCPHHVVQVLTKRADRMRLVLSHPDFEAEVAHWMIELAPVGRHLSGNGPVLRIGGPASVEHWPLPNVWLGVSAEDQARADERIPELLNTPAALRWVSAEPLLAPLDLRPWLRGETGCGGCDDGEGMARNRCSYSDIPRDEQCPLNFAVYTYPEGPSNEHGEPEWVAEVRLTLDWVVAGGESGPGARPMNPDWAREIRDHCAAGGTPFHFKQWGAWGPGEACPNLNARDCASLFDGRWEFDRVPAGPSDDHIDDEPDVYRIGKKAAGRLLDGVTHDGFPEPR